MESRGRWTGDYVENVGRPPGTGRDERPGARRLELRGQAEERLLPVVDGVSRTSTGRCPELLEGSKTRLAFAEIFSVCRRAKSITRGVTHEPRR
jgi:hypothetical protein